MKKKLLVLLLTAIAVLCGALCFTACDFLSGNGSGTSGGSGSSGSGGSGGGGGGDLHKHEFTIWVDEVPATCAKQGVRGHYECECGAADSDDLGTPVNPAAHTYGAWVEEVYATCTAAGMRAHYHCACGKYFDSGKKEVSEQSLILPISEGSHELKEGEVNCANCGKPVTQGLEYTLLSDGTYSVKRGAATDKDIIIPAKYNGIPVTTIGIGAFSVKENLGEEPSEEEEYEALESVVIPDSVTTIGANAFIRCASLKSLTIPDSVTTIDGYAFTYCTGLESVTGGNNVTSVERSAFYSCDNIKTVVAPFKIVDIIPTYGLTHVTVTSGATDYGAFHNCWDLKTITIGSEVTSIGEDPFGLGCPDLESITVDENNKYYASDQGILYNKYKTDILHVPNRISGYITVPKGVTMIDFEEFKNRGSLQGIELPEGVNSIQEYAFQGCINLISAKLPESLTYLQSFAFEGCTGLQSVEFGNSPKLKYMADSVFKGCTSLQSISIPDGVPDIGTSVFEGCAKLTDVNFGSGSKLVRIYGSAFKDCTSLENMTIPKGVNYIEYDSFDGCSRIQREDGVGYVDKWAVNFDGSLTEVTLRENTTGIAVKVFDQQWDLTGVSFGENSELAIICGSAFENCASLDIVLPQGVKYIGGSAFRGCETLHDIAIPESVTFVGWGAFWGCENLLQWDGGVGYVDGWAIMTESEFAETEVTIKNGTVGIAGGLFGNFGQLRAVSIPEGVKYIGNSAFMGTGLERIIIPDSVISVGGWAFDNCTSLTEVKIGGGVTSLGENAFHACSSLQTISIPANITSIGEGAFNDCASLTRIDFAANSSLASIGGSAFENCERLQSIIIPAGVKYIGPSAFCNCKGLISATFENKTGWKLVDESNSLEPCDIAIGTPAENAENLKDMNLTSFSWVRS